MYKSKNYFKICIPWDLHLDMVSIGWIWEEYTFLMKNVYYIIVKSTIFYFSGTGNSLWVAKELQKQLEESELVPIAKVIQEDRILATTQTIGFIFPLYYYGLPKIILNFVTDLILDDSNYFFAVITKGGDLNGDPLIQLERVLRQKQKNLNAGYFIKMPTNFILKSSEITTEEINELMRNAIKVIKEISNDIKNGRSNLELDVQDKPSFLERRNLVFQEKVNASDKQFYSNESCNSCGICEKICPADNIILIEGKPQWQHKCQQCLACINYCPKKSIQWGKNTINTRRYQHPNIKINELMDQKRNSRMILF